MMGKFMTDGFVTDAFGRMYDGLIYDLMHMERLGGMGDVCSLQAQLHERQHLARVRGRSVGVARFR